MAWTSGDLPMTVRPSALGWGLILLRGGCIVVLTVVGLFLLLVVRLAERPLFGPGRPWTLCIAQACCRNMLRIMGIGFCTEGPALRGAGAVVSNHVSWLDILALNANRGVRFIAKSEVSGWPWIGWLARAAGTVFIARRPSHAGRQKLIFKNWLGAGQTLLFFPEGTSTDGCRVLPFKSTLFAAFLAPELRGSLQIQPVSVIYHAPPGRDRRFYGWWGDMGFGAHLLQVLATPRQGWVEVICHPPVQVARFPDRKALAHHCATVIRNTVETRLGIPGGA